MYRHSLASFLGLATVFSLGASAAQPSTQPNPEALAPGRTEFLSLQLASVENSILTVNRALAQSGYKAATSAARAAQFDLNNINLDRNGGGPIPWWKFYGMNVKDFTYTNAAGDRNPVARPAQFDYLYKANSKLRARADEQASTLSRKTDELLDRRRALEAEQTALWATLAWETVSQRKADENPFYCNALKSVGPPSRQAEARRSSLEATLTFLAVTDQCMKSSLDSVSANPAATFDNIAERLKSAYETFRSSVSDAIRTGDLPDEDRAAVNALDADCKHLSDFYLNAADAYKKALERDADKDEAGKGDFRKHLQLALLDSSQAIYRLDNQIPSLAKSWSIEPDAKQKVVRAAAGAAAAVDLPAPVAQPLDTLFTKGTTFNGIYETRKDGNSSSQTVEATVLRIDANSIMLQTNQAGGAIWTWEFSIKGSTLQLKPNGFKRIRARSDNKAPPPTTGTTATGTITANKITFDYTWPKVQVGSMTLNKAP